MKQKWKILLKDYCNNVEEGNNKDEEQEVVRSTNRRCAIAILCTILILVFGYLALKYFTFSHMETAHITADKLRSLNEIISDVQTTVTSDKQTEVTTEKQKMNSLESASEASPASLSTTKEKTPEDCVNLPLPLPVHICVPSRGDLDHIEDFDYEHHNLRIFRVCRRFINNRPYPVYVSEIMSNEGIRRHLVKRFASYFPRQKFDKTKFDLEENESDEGAPNEAMDDNGKRMTTAGDSYRRVTTRNDISKIFSSFNNTKFNMTSRQMMMLLHKFYMLGKEVTENHTLVKRSALPREALDKSPKSSFELTNQLDRNYGELLRRLKDRYFHNVDKKKKDTLFAPLEEKLGLLDMMRKRCYRKVKSIREIMGMQKVGNKKFFLSYLEKERALKERDKKLRDCLSQFEQREK